MTHIDRMRKLQRETREAIRLQERLGGAAAGPAAPGGGGAAGDGTATELRRMRTLFEAKDPALFDLEHGGG